MLCVIMFFRNRNNKLRKKVACLSSSNDDLIKMKSDLENKINANNLTISSIKKEITNQEEKISEYQSRLFSISQNCAELENQLGIQNDANKELLSCIDNYSNTIKEKDEINALLTSSLKAANSSLRELRDSIEDSRLKLKNTVASRYEMLDRISKTYYEMGDVITPKNKLLRTVVSIIDDIKSAKSGLKEMEDFINLNLDNLIKNFKEDFPTLKDYEYNLYMFLILGFSFRSISVFQDVSLENLYNRKSSLIKKINSNFTTAIDYLSYLR